MIVLAMPALWLFTASVCLFDTVEGEVNCRLEDLVISFSGADRPPPLGFRTQPDLEFLDQNAILPTASTCSLVIRLPICHSNYDDFKDAMILALHGNNGFGGP